MGKITVMIPDALEREVRSYIAKEFAQQPYGKLSEFVTKSLELLLTYYADKEIAVEESQ